MIFPFVQQINHLAFTFYLKFTVSKGYITSEECFGGQTLYASARFNIHELPVSSNAISHSPRKNKH